MRTKHADEKGRIEIRKRYPSCEKGSKPSKRRRWKRSLVAGKGSEREATYELKSRNRFRRPNSRPPAHDLESGGPTARVTAVLTGVGPSDQRVSVLTTCVRCPECRSWSPLASLSRKFKKCKRVFKASLTCPSPRSPTRTSQPWGGTRGCKQGPPAMATRVGQGAVAPSTPAGDTARAEPPS